MGPVPRVMPAIRYQAVVMPLRRAGSSLKGARPMYPNGFECVCGWLQCLGGGLFWGVWGVLSQACWGVGQHGLEYMGGLSFGFCSCWRFVGGLHVVGLPVGFGCRIVWCGVLVSSWSGGG